MVNSKNTSYKFIKKDLFFMYLKKQDTFVVKFQKKSIFCFTNLLVKSIFYTKIRINKKLKKLINYYFMINLSALVYLERFGLLKLKLKV